MKALVICIIFVAMATICLSQTQTAQNLPAWTKQTVSVQKTEKQQNDKLIIITCVYVMKTVYKNGNIISSGEISQQEAEKIANQFGYKWVDTGYDVAIGDSFSVKVNGNNEIYQKIELKIYGSKK